MAKIKKKQASEGNFYSSLGLGVITALIGMLLGLLSLSVQEATEVRQMPDEEKIEPKTVYYIIGQDRGGNYKGMLRAFIEQQKGTIRLQEQDLNRWASDNFKFGGPKGAEEEAGLITLKPTAPNFRIANGIMTIGMTVEVGMFGSSHKMRYQTTGVFEPSGSGYAFQPFDSYLGSAHLPPVVVGPTVSGALYGVFTNTEQFPALHNSWLGLSNVSLDGDSLLLTRQ